MKFDDLTQFLPKLITEITEKEMQSIEGKEPTLEDLKNAMRRVKEIRMLAFHQAPYMGEILRSLRFIFDAPGIDTAAVDPFGNIYFNSLFVKLLDQWELAFVVFHEASHITLQHLLRRGDKVPDIANIAEDAIINYLLLKEGLTPPAIGVLPNEDGKLYELKNEITFKPPIEIRDKITEQVYEEILKQIKKLLKFPTIPGFDEHLLQEQDGGYDENQEKNINDGQSPKKREVQKGPDGTPGSGGDKNKPLDPETNKQLKKKWNEVNERAKQVKKGRSAGGTGDLIMQQMMVETEGRVDWRTALREFVSSISSEKIYDPKSISRRGYSSRSYIAKRKSTEGEYDMILAIDISGSVRDYYSNFLAEVLLLFAEFNVTALFMWWDTSVKQPVIHLTNDNSDEVLEYTPTSGGTTISCVAQYIRANDLSPENIVYFTDGEVESDPDIYKEEGMHDLVILCPNGTHSILEGKVDNVVEMLS